MEAITAFFSSVMNAQFDFTALGNFFGWYITSIKENAELLGMWEAVWQYIAPYAFVVPIALIVLSAICLFFGKKILPFIRFLACVVIGYAVGVITVSPLINSVFTLPNYVSGIVVAIVAGALSKIVYYLAITVGVGYVSYMVCMRGEILPQLTSFSKGNTIVCLIVAVIAVVLVFLLRKFLEMGATAFAGAFFISEVVIANYVDYTALIPFDANIVKYVAVGVVALIGFIVQFKTRTRY